MISELFPSHQIWNLLLGGGWTILLLKGPGPERQVLAVAWG